ncbi:hypothetical protein PSTT_11763, partial [Puccinia striiformis]
ACYYDIVTRRMITQLFTGAWSVEVGYTDHTHKHFQLLILFGQGIVYALTVVVGLILILSHELLQKGYDLLLGTSLFIATNIFESITWKAISPTTINIGRGPQFGGALIACSIFHVEQQNWTLKKAFYPDRLLNVMNSNATVVIFAAVIYLQGFQV